MKDRTEEMRNLVSNFHLLDYIHLRLEDAFDKNWWSKVGGLPHSHHINVDTTDEDLPILSESTTSVSGTPASLLQAYLTSLPTQTAFVTAVRSLIRLLLLYTAMSTGSSHLLLGTSLTSLSVSLVSTIAQGGGFSIREETQEEWRPRFSISDNGQQNRVIRVVRPLHDIGLKECALWAWWSGISAVGAHRDFIPKQSIGLLTRDFVGGLERDYPSTVSTIARTSAKLVPKKGESRTCSLCERPAQVTVQGWKSQISIRSSNAMSSASSARENFRLLAPSICYMCHTTLTSKSNRCTPALISSPKSVPLPLWVTSHVDLGARLHNPILPGCQDPEFTDVWSRTKMSNEQMKEQIAEFVFADESSL